MLTPLTKLVLYYKLPVAAKLRKGETFQKKMIVRTYGRRSRGGIGRTLSDSTFNGDVSDDPFSFSEEEEEEESPQDYNFTYSSSQDSARWTFDSEPYSMSQDAGPDPARIKPLLEPLGGSKKPKNEKGEAKFYRPPPPVKPPPLTATLMETQEFGEMMEYVDEVNFALDGLKNRQPVRIRRASLLSLLTVCETSQQRRLLRAHGMEKTIVDAIMSLSLDDPPSNLAASALFYILTADGQDNYLLDLSSSIGFLKRLLKPLASDNIVKKTPSIGTKLLALRKDAHFSRDMAKKIDQSDDAITQKVKEILVSCKDIKVRDDINHRNSRPELSPKWIALLTMEKACLSNVSFEEGAVRRTGGNFKEKLRELGGLNAVFELAISFRSSLERWLDHISAPSKAYKDEDNLQFLVQLSKCLKIMENATFLSKENQSHLLAMRRFLTETKSSLSFTKLVINFVKVLSGLCLLRRNSLTSSAAETPLHFSIESEQSREFLSMEENKADSSRVSFTTSSQECSSSGRVFPGLGLNKSQRKQWLSSQSESQETAYVEDNCMIKMRIGSSMSSSSSMNSNRTGCGAMINGAHMKMKSSLGKRPCDNRDPFAFDEDAVFINLEDSQEDPFAFDEDEVKPSKWDILSQRNGVARPKRSRLGGVACQDFEDGCSSRIIPKPEEVKQIENQCSSQTSCSSVVGEEASDILADCLLTSVKVLMNLTNDNEVGCQQIAACGGLETLSSLIVNHFPSFLQPLHSPSEMRDFDSLCNSVIDLESQPDVRLTDQEIDLLVAILGLLVNMVEKDDQNRSRLAATSISLPCSQGLVEESQRDVIPLLCSIFLANQGAGEAVGEGNETWDEETVLVQGEKEAEKMIIEAYSALLLAFLSTESRSTREIIAGYLPTKKLSVLVPVLERFVAFHVTLDMISPETHKSVNEVIESLRFA
ncbi:hypothetical protein V2J09_009921 [Rumex salicifolius]